MNRIPIRIIYLLTLLLFLVCKEDSAPPGNEEEMETLSAIYLLEPAHDRELLRLKPDRSCEWTRNADRQICAYRYRQGILEIFTRTKADAIGAFQLSDKGGRGLWEGRTRFLVRCENCE